MRQRTTRAHLKLVKLPWDQAITINPFDVTNFFFNYTVKNEGWLMGTKIGFSTNNLFNNQNIVGISAATKATLAVPFAASPNDLINTLPGRSVMVSLTVGLAAEALAFTRFFQGLRASSLFNCRRPNRHSHRWVRRVDPV
jgi:hypothetical protein